MQAGGELRRTRLIVNADDFGKDSETVKATVACFDDGILTSASIMPNMSATRSAAEFAVGHPTFSFGVHLTFAGDGEERPISDPVDIPALVSSDGCFLPSKTVRLRLLLGQIPVMQIQREMTAQLRRMVDMGVDISHVDSHCHLHKFQPFLMALERILPSFGIDRVRTAQDLYITKQYRSPTYWYGPSWKRCISKRFRTTDHFFMASNVEDANSMESLVPRLPGGTVEIGGHPGRSGWRDAERLAMERVSSAATALGLELISWKEL